MNDHRLAAKGDIIHQLATIDGDLQLNRSIRRRNPPSALRVRRWWRMRRAKSRRLVQSIYRDSSSFNDDCIAAAKLRLLLDGDSSSLSAASRQMFDSSINDGPKAAQHLETSFLEMSGRRLWRQEHVDEIVQSLFHPFANALAARSPSVSVITPLSYPLLAQNHRVSL